MTNFKDMMGITMDFCLNIFLIDAAGQTNFQIYEKSLKMGHSKVLLQEPKMRNR